MSWQHFTVIKARRRIISVISSDEDDDEDAGPMEFDDIDGETP